MVAVDKGCVGCGLSAADCICEDEGEEDRTPTCMDCGNFLDPNGFCDVCDEDES